MKTEEGIRERLERLKKLQEMLSYKVPKEIIITNAYIEILKWVLEEKEK